MILILFGIIMFSKQQHKAYLLLVDYLYYTF